MQQLIPGNRHKQTTFYTNTRTKLLHCVLLMSLLQSFGSLYNIPNVWTPGYAAVDVLHASRTLAYLKAEESVVIYDRATTLHSGKFKRFNMNFVSQPVKSAGNVVTATGSVNKLQVTTLLPANANITVRVGRMFDTLLVTLCANECWLAAFNANG